MRVHGFTLIELLVVIAILGILAIGLIVALNPIEQINRANDSTMLSVSKQFISATSQFQTDTQYTAACPDITCASYDNGLNSSTSVPMSQVSSVNSRLFTDGTSHAANDFTSNSQSASILLTLTNTSPAKDATFIVCWKPASLAEKSKADVNNINTPVFNDTGVLQSAAACPASGSNNCYRCLRQ